MFESFWWAVESFKRSFTSTSIGTKVLKSLRKFINGLPLVI